MTAMATGGGDIAGSNRYKNHLGRMTARILGVDLVYLEYNSSLHSLRKRTCKSFFTSNYISLKGDPGVPHPLHLPPHPSQYTAIQHFRVIWSQTQRQSCHVLISPAVHYQRLFARDDEVSEKVDQSQVPTELIYLSHSDRN